CPPLRGLQWQAHAVLRIGRLHNMDIVLPHPSISRRHAEVVALGPGWFARDLGSAEGTFVNGARVGPPGHPLRPPDPLRVGELTLSVHFEEEKAAPPTEDLPTHIKASSVYLRVQARARHSHDQALEALAREQNHPPRQARHLSALLRTGRFLCHSTSLD